MPVARIPIMVSWSGGKDSALLLQHLLGDAQYEVMGLVTTVTEVYDRISIHGVRREILHAQGTQLGLPVHEVTIPPTASNPVYEAAFAAALHRLRAGASSLRTIAFGDLFLADVRSYRERLLASLGWIPRFPLWGRNTTALARQFVRDGFGAIVCCVDTMQLAAEWSGRDFDARLLDALPVGVDPCGERGEFHTCVHAGPIFAHPIRLERGERVRREGRFEYCDLLLQKPASGALSVRPTPLTSSRG